MKTGENPAIGLDNVVIAKLLSDEAGKKPTYGTPIALKGAVNATANPNSSVETDYADNGAFFVADNRGNLEMSLEFTNIDPATKAEMLGQKRVNGVTIETSQDQAPYWALGFRVWIGGLDENGEKIYELFWYAKGKFSVPESGGSTKQESIDFQHVSMTAQFVSTIWSPDGKGGVFCNHCRTDFDTPQALINSWFNAPVLSPEVDTTKLTVAIAQDGTNKSKIKITASKESGETPVIAESTAKLNETVIIINDGNAVEGEFTFNGNVATFTASTPFSASDEVSVTVTSGLKDTDGVGCTPASTVVTIA